MSEPPPKPEITEYATARDRAKISAFAASSAGAGHFGCGPALLWILAPFADPHNWGYLILVTLPIKLAPISLAIALAALLTSLAAIRATPKSRGERRKLAKGGLALGIVTTFMWGGIFSIRAFAAAIGYFSGPRAERRRDSVFE